MLSMSLLDAMKTKENELSRMLLHLNTIRLVTLYTTTWKEMKSRSAHYMQSWLGTRCLRFKMGGSALPVPRPIKHTVNMVNRGSVRAMEKEDPLPIKCIVYLREKVFCFMFYVVVVFFFYFCLGFLLFSLETSTLSPVYIFFRCQ